MNGLIIAIIASVISLFAGYMYRKKIAEGKLNEAEIVAKRMVETAEKESEAIKKEKG